MNCHAPLVNGDSDRYEVEWDAEARVTPMGSPVFTAKYLQTGGLMDRLCDYTPLAYSSNNAPKERDVLGANVLSIFNGQTRYAHINARLVPDDVPSKSQPWPP